MPTLPFMIDDHFWVALSTIVNVMLVLIVVYTEFVKPKLLAPRLDVYYVDGSGFVVEKDMEVRGVGGKFVHAVNLRVRNLGRSSAHKIIGRITDVVSVETNRRIEGFFPVPLNWAGPPNTAETVDLNRFDEEFLGFISVYSDPTYLYTGSDPMPNREHRFIPADKQPYIFTVSLYSDNAPTVRRRFKVSWDDPKKHWDKVNISRLP
ncbi:MAG: hypothetical protein HYR71_12370 [Chloroflexi bacterium]|nr:hypothetical protein [Chloroflexota bacterium]